MGKSPQLENGYTKIANEIMNALVAYRIPGEQMQCLLFIIRKTYGFNKKEDAISNKQFCDATGLKRSSVCRAINGLIDKNIVSKKANKVVPTYRFNKNYSKWKVLAKKLTGEVLAKKLTGSLKKANNLLAKKRPTKEKKRNYTKERRAGAHFNEEKKQKERDFRIIKKRGAGWEYLASTYAYPGEQMPEFLNRVENELKGTSCEN